MKTQFRPLLTRTGLLFALLAGPAMARHNYQGYLLGDRASGMGGAVVATADSVDACYYNPAGLARLAESSLSLSASLYGRESYTAKDGLFPGEDARYDSFVTIPSTVGGMWKISDRQALAFSIFIPYHNNYNELRSFQDNKHIYNYNLDDQTLWLGPSAAWAVNERLAIGASVFGVYRTYNEFTSLFFEEVDLGYARGHKFSDWGALAALGVQYQLLQKLRVGAMLRSPSMHITGSGDYQVYQVSPESSVSIYARDIDTRDRVPAQISLGAAWQELRLYTLAADVHYHIGDSFNLQEFTYDGERHALRIRRRDVLNCNLGAEYFWRGIYPLRTGFFTNFSAAPGVDPDDTDNSFKIDTYGISASVGRRAAHVSANVGVIGVWGSGRTLGWIPDGDNVQLGTTSAHVFNIYLVASTAYAF